MIIEYASKLHIDKFNYVPITDVLKIENQGVYAQILSNESGINLELLSPLNDKSPINSFIRRGIGIAHICFRTNNFDLEYKRLKRWVVREALPAPMEYFKGGRTFFINNGIYLTEYLEVIEN